MQCRIARLVALGVVLSAIGLSAQQPDKTPAQRYEDLVETTQLDRQGAQPFHLKIDAQLFDPEGKPADKGTIEEWWAAPDQYRIEVNSGSLHEVIASGQPTQDIEDNRANYLLGQLLQETVHPLHKLAVQDTVSMDTREFGKATLDCFQPRNLVTLGLDVANACTDAGTDNLRVEVRHMELVVRNSVGTFAGTHVALSTRIAYMDRDIVSGTITSLQRLTPGLPGAPALIPGKAAAKTEASPVRVQSGVIRGHILNKTQPTYPLYARREGIGGTVLLHAIITREGKISDLFTITSPNRVLSDAAMDAVRTWTYQPYLLNGQPTEVDTVVTVNFNLNGRTF